MKLFQVTIESCQSDSDEILTEKWYVTGETIKSVTDYFTRYCSEYEKELKGVHEIVTTVQHIYDEPYSAETTNEEKQQ